MEALDYLEASAAQTLEVVRNGYDDLHERAHKLATLLIGGAGGVAAYALAQFGKDPAALYAWAPLAGLALSWFGVAAVLMWAGLRAQEVSAGPKIGTLLERWRYEVQAGAEPDKALADLREAALDKMPQRIAGYVTASNTRADAIDAAYRAVAVSSVAVPLAVIGACRWFGG